jgi:hypothetical protein
LARFLPLRKALKQATITGIIDIGIIVTGTIIIITGTTSKEDIGPIGMVCKFSFPFRTNGNAALRSFWSALNALKTV